MIGNGCIKCSEVNNNSQCSYRVEAKVGLVVSIRDTEVILQLLFFIYGTVFHSNNYKPV